MQLHPRVSRVEKRENRERIEKIEKIEKQRKQNRENREIEKIEKKEKIERIERIEKEALPIVFGLKQFHSYLYGLGRLHSLQIISRCSRFFVKSGFFRNYLEIQIFFSIFQLYMYARAYVCIWTLQSCRIDEVNQRNSA